MASMGLQSFAQLKDQKRISKSVGQNRYVTCIAEALIQELDISKRDGWEVVVFDDETANAFALPGRRIGVHTGLLEVARNQDQLAAVLGHEIGHVLARHSNERMSQSFASMAGLAVISSMTDTDTARGRAAVAALGLGAQYGIIMPFSRKHESEADLMGLELMALAGFDPEQSVVLWQNMDKAGGPGPPEFMSTHPSHETRIESLRAGVPAARQIRARAREHGRNPHCTE